MVFEKVRRIICDQLDVEEDNVTMNSVLTDDLSADSLDLVEVDFRENDLLGDTERVVSVTIKCIGIYTL